MRHDNCGSRDGWSVGSIQPSSESHAIRRKRDVITQSSPRCFYPCLAAELVSSLGNALLNDIRRDRRQSHRTFFCGCIFAGFKGFTNFAVALGVEGAAEEHRSAEEHQYNGSDQIGHLQSEYGLDLHAPSGKAKLWVMASSRLRCTPWSSWSSRIWVIGVSRVRVANVRRCRCSLQPDTRATPSCITDRLIQTSCYSGQSDGANIHFQRTCSSSALRKPSWVVTQASQARAVHFSLSAGTAAGID
jgi:hypothetical protein